MQTVDLIAETVTRTAMSVRRLCRIVRVSRTIADLEESDTILESHITEAVRFRSVDRKYWGVETI